MTCNRNVDTDMRVLVYIAFKVCSYFYTKDGNVWRLTNIFSINYSSLTAAFISK